MVAMLLALMSGGNAAASVYHDETTKVTSFDYSQYEYTYVEDGVEKTAKLTDEATTPDQIIGLLKAVYTDGTIPGIHYAYDYNGYQSRKIDYNTYGHLGSGLWKRANNEYYPNPEQDGMTLLLVNLKETWRRSHATNLSPREYVEQAYSSVKLVTSFTRINDEKNPGYLFTVDGNSNRFFFISKGKPRSTYTKPLFRLFEQISPVRGDDDPNADQIQDLRSGNAYYCYHDCTDVGSTPHATYDHWFTISKSGEAHSLKNLSIFIPDRRFEHNLNDEYDDNKIDSEYYCDYGNSDKPGEEDWEVMPHVLLYTATLNAEAVPADETGYFDVNLDWSTSFTKENTGVDVPQHFYVYTIDENGRHQLESVVDQPVTVREHSFRVLQTADPQTFKFVITAHPINFDKDGNILRDKDGNPVITMTAESPVRTVVVPGFSPYFTQATNYRSRYDVRNQVNIYKNKLAIRPTTQKDYAAIKNNREQYDVTRTDDAGNKVTIAHVQFTPLETQPGYEYSIEYNADTQVTNGLVFDDETPSLSGTLMSYDDAIVYVIDRFTASTATNEHSSRYIYHFEQYNDDYSNVLEVPVYKTTNMVNGNGHTIGEVIDDTHHDVKSTPDNTITFSVMNDPAANLLRYDVYRVANNYSTERVAKAEHFDNNGEYHVYELNEKGQLNDLVGEFCFGPEGGSITVGDSKKSVGNRINRYVPVITTLLDGDLNMPNTYGCYYEQTSYPQVRIEATDLIKSQQMGSGENASMGYRATITLSPVLPTDLRYVYYYRVWRVLDKNTRFTDEVLLNDDDESVTNQWCDYTELKTIYPGTDPVKAIDTYLDKALVDTKPVTYIVRLYATDISKDSENATLSLNRAPGSDKGGKDYFVAENKVSIVYDGSVVTALDDIVTDIKGQVKSVTYYNTLGIASDTPFPGINIVVTQYDNGKTTTNKILK